jgi:hypothetical protein
MASSYKIQFNDTIGEPKSIPPVSQIGAGSGAGVPYRDHRHTFLHLGKVSSYRRTPNVDLIKIEQFENRKDEAFYLISTKDGEFVQKMTNTNSKLAVDEGDVVAAFVVVDAVVVGEVPVLLFWWRRLESLADHNFALAHCRSPTGSPRRRSV